MIGKEPTTSNRSTESGLSHATWRTTARQSPVQSTRYRQDVGNRKQPVRVGSSSPKLPAIRLCCHCWCPGRLTALALLKPRERRGCVLLYSKVRRATNKETSSCALKCLPS